MITFQLSTLTWALLGLDDHAYARQTYPTLTSKKRGVYQADESDALAILDSLNEHAGPDFDHTEAERRALTRAARKMMTTLLLSTKRATT